MKQFEIHNVVLGHEELRSAIFNYARDMMVAVPETAKICISSPRRDEMRVTISWESEAVAALQPNEASTERN